jgi:hypothetical protein
MAEFVAMSEVRKLIDEAIEPFNVLPRIEITLKTHGNKLRDNEVSHKSLLKEIANIKGALAEFNVVDRSIKKLEQNCANTKKWQQDFETNSELKN